MKQRRLLKRSTLEIIIKILEDRRPFTSNGLAFATGIAPRTVSQTIKRFRCDGWIACDARYGVDRKVGRHFAYRLTLKGRKEAHAALRKQASFTGGKWHLDAPIRSERMGSARPKSDAPAVRIKTDNAGISPVRTPPRPGRSRQRLGAFAARSGLSAGGAIEGVERDGPAVGH